MPFYSKKPKKKPLFEKTVSGEKPKRTKKSKERSLIEKLDKIFSQFIRLRDSKPYGYAAFRCISCGRVLPVADADCGHYRSRANMSTRFDEKNCHAECRKCNRMDGDHLIGYRANLCRKIGTGQVELLDYLCHQPKKWTEFELKNMIKYYGALVEMMRSEGGRI